MLIIHYEVKSNSVYLTEVLDDGREVDVESDDPRYIKMCQEILDHFQPPPDYEAAIERIAEKYVGACEVKIDATSD